MPESRPTWKQPPDALVAKLWPLVQKGWPARLDDLCAPTDIPRATLYYYVPGMPAFVAWAVDEQLRRSAELGRDAAIGASSPAAALDAACTALLRAWSAAPHIASRLLDRAGTDGTAWDDLQTLIERLIAGTEPGRRASTRYRSVALLGALAALATERAPRRAAIAAVRALAGNAV